MTQHIIVIPTHGRGLYPITDRIVATLPDSTTESGLVNVFIQHTSASLTIQENADPDVMRDLDAFMNRLVPDGDPLYMHTAEGPDDMPAHVRAALTATSLTIPMTAGRLALGRWQGVYLWEHRTRPHQRRIVVTVCE